ncbi:hypothetical protein SY83_00505 [Paenibacillus swuensis]|uniref:Xylose isomerase-like TIM barrel domain-containing protein n=1 Tax=Paenibacillus swuensis TaxID=1178515 RepID=A0A172TDL1_9BACL|nr:sugar phosphate isomerase/epimerase family protein [Paenibacillus swuensis]ANE45091.1 hypothetical protein SY83_00505 [Paenibacillus swuensis]
MKLSYTTLATPGYTAKESIFAAKKYGYAGVDLRVSDLQTNIDINEVRDTAQAQDIAISSLLCYPPRILPSQSSWESFKQDLLRDLKLAAAVGAPSIRTFCHIPDNLTTEWYFAKTTELLIEILERDSSDVNIYIQNHRTHATTRQILKLLDLVSHPRVGLLFSPDHCMKLEEDLLKHPEPLLPYVRQLYIADVYPKEDAFPDVLPGLGKVPLEELVHQFKEARFQGWASFKWEKTHHMDLAGPEIALPHFINFMARVPL